MDKLKPLVNNKDLYEAFLEELDDLIEVQRKGLEQATGEPILYRHQGAISALRSLKNLRDKVNYAG